MKNAYFDEGKSWFEDRYLTLSIHLRRYCIALIVALIVNLMLVSIVLCLLPLKTLVPLVVHHNTTTGEVWVNRPQTPYVPETDAETQADIVRYMASRESYSASDINQRFHLVNLLSDSAVAERYRQEQSNQNPMAPVNVLRDEGSRTVKIEDIVFIDKAGQKEIRNFRKPSKNLAKIDFVTVTTDFKGQQRTEFWVATLAWEYRGLPHTQAEAWDNWNGFTVTDYRVDPRNITSK